MKILEYGNKKNKKIILIHGFQTPYTVMNPYIEYFKNKYYVYVIILPGHYPNKEKFISFDNTAIEIEEYISDDIYMIYGISMGGVLACRIIERKNINVEKLILDSTPLISYSNIMKFFMKKVYLFMMYLTKKDLLLLLR